MKKKIIECMKKNKNLSYLIPAVIATICVSIALTGYKEASYDIETDANIDVIAKAMVNDEEVYTSTKDKEVDMDKQVEESGENIKETMEDTIKDTTENITDNKIDNTTENIAENIAENTAENIIENTTENTAENITEKSVNTTTSANKETKCTSSKDKNKEKETKQTSNNKTNKNDISSETTNNSIDKSQPNKSENNQKETQVIDDKKTYTVTVYCCPDEYEDFYDYAITVTATVKNGKIISVDNVSGVDENCDEANAYYLKRAYEGTSSLQGIKTQVQSGKDLGQVDVVSGATCSSNAIKMALDNILKMAS